MRFSGTATKSEMANIQGLKDGFSPSVLFLSLFFLFADVMGNHDDDSETPSKAPVNELRPALTYTTQTRSRSVASTSVPPALIPQRPAPSPTRPTHTTRPRASISNGQDNAAMARTVGTRTSRSAIPPPSAWISRRSGGVTPERLVERDTRGSVESIARRASARGGRSVS